MFDIGFWEVTLIAVVGLMVVGPERLPTVLGTVGRWVGRARAYVTNIRRDIEREVRRVEAEAKAQVDLTELKQVVEQVGDEVTASKVSLEQHLQGGDREAPLADESPADVLTTEPPDIEAPAKFGPLNEPLDKSLNEPLDEPLDEPVKKGGNNESIQHVAS